MTLNTLTLAVIFFLFHCLVCSGETDKIIKDIEFAKINNHSLKLDLHLPKKVKGSKLVVWIHGGGWHKGSKNDCKIKWLTTHGYSVASISYRLSQIAKFPAQIHDCKAAIRWLRAQENKFGYDSSKIVAAGASAGGYLATLLGTSDGVKQLEGNVGGNLEMNSSLSGIINYYGPTDFILRSKTQPHRANKVGSVVYNLLGGGADKKVKLATLASPVYHVTKNDPPILIFHGDKDATVLIDQANAITSAYKKMNLSVNMNTLPGKKHGGTEFYTGENRKKVLQFLGKIVESASH
ncbi:MAG: lipase [Verrucomicrobiales bacterium]|nr:lipase [Verrucomicrobiales bacterium]|tara:strand:- start:9404 stop:10282 length:879 start_codon:yes stop_codon:yes gene_type:complete